MGILFLAARLIDAVTDPLMGLITDRVKSERFGRFRPYFLYLAVPFGVSVFLMFTTPDWSYNAKLVWAYATYILVTLMFTSVTIPYISLIGVLTSLISAYYYLRVIVVMYMRDGEPQVHHEPWLYFTAYAAAIGVVLLSLFAAPLFQWASQAMLQLASAL